MTRKHVCGGIGDILELTFLDLEILPKNAFGTQHFETSHF